MSLAWHCGEIDGGDEGDTGEERRASWAEDVTNLRAYHLWLAVTHRLVVIGPWSVVRRAQHPYIRGELWAFLLSL